MLIKQHFQMLLSRLGQIFDILDKPVFGPRLPRLSGDPCASGLHEQAAMSTGVIVRGCAATMLTQAHNDIVSIQWRQAQYSILGDSYETDIS